MAKSKRLEITLPPVLYKQFDEECKYSGQSMAEYLRDSGRRESERRQSVRTEQKQLGLVEDAVQNGMAV